MPRLVSNPQNFNEEMVASDSQRKGISYANEVTMMIAADLIGRQFNIQANLAVVVTLPRPFPSVSRSLQPQAHRYV